LSDLPIVTIIVPTRNEEHGIEACVRSLLSQRYPTATIEVAVVDGGSTDGTRRVVSALAEEQVRLPHNLAGIAASAFNIGVAATTGSLGSSVSEHSTLDPDYAAAFQMSGAALVGGRLEAAVDADAAARAQAIVRATSSVSVRPVHYSDNPGWVDTAFPGAYSGTCSHRLEDSMTRSSATRMTSCTCLPPPLVCTSPRVQGFGVVWHT
jgi:succinoglycan biosynthesis protein ExoA